MKQSTSTPGNKTPKTTNTPPKEQAQPQTDSSVSVEEIADVMNQASAKIAELTDDLQRTRADFENYRKQVESQKSQAMASAKYATVVKFLPMVDDFARAIATYPKELAPLEKSFHKTLATLGLSQLDSQPETEFNPDFHEAVSVEDDEGEVEVIAETLRPGYLYEGEVIRPAMVKVKHATK